MATVESPSTSGSARLALDRPNVRYDLLRAPLIGRVFRWRWGRLAFQGVLLLVAALLVYDGFTGPRLAAQNLATVSVWVHYRGLIMLSLLLAGNFFCMACPFALPRTIARRISAAGGRWPRALRNKWLAIAVFVGFLFAYEWLDLWASPLLTAWVIIIYFVAAFALEALFAESPFCKYVCPIGTFNFLGASASPSQITVYSGDVCRTCPGKECVNGSQQVLGCVTELFPPTLTSNLDCVYCLDCARACPYDNVALTVRAPGRELVASGWPQRVDVAFMAMVFAFAGLSNAFGMVPPFYDLQNAIARTFGLGNEAVVLFLIFAVLMIALPAISGAVAAWTSQRLAGQPEPLSRTFTRYAPATVPVAMGIWLAHYGFHFATGALAIIPVFQSFLLDHGIDWLGATPNWSLGPILPGTLLLPLQTLAVLFGFVASLTVASRIGRERYADPATRTRAILPWVLIYLALAIIALYLFNLPMEMRGTVFMGG